MKIIDQSVEIMTPLSQDKILKHLEKCIRVCYKSEHKITKTSAPSFIRKIIESGHEAAIEHFNITVRFITDRATANEITRHRLASYCQESTRYCNYTKNQFGNEITVIYPDYLDGEKYNIWQDSCLNSEATYFKLLNEYGATPQEARSVLPLSLKTELVMTANVREWRYFLKLRGSKRAHPQLVSLVKMLYGKLMEEVPVLFEDITFKEG